MAVLLVVLSHWSVDTWRFGGTVGVTVFFVLSGYLITSILLAEHGATGAIGLRAFYARRALRLFPALAVVVVAIPFLQKATADPRLTYEYVWWALSAILYVGNFDRAAGETLGPLNHTWSLAVEEQFYLVWPLVLLAVLWWARRDARAVLRAVAALAGVALAWQVVAAFVLDFDRTYFALDTNAYALLIGCALAAWLRLAPRAGTGPVWPTWVALAALVGMAAIPSIEYAGVDLRIAAHGAPLAALAAAALVVAAVGCPGRGPLVWRPLTWFGTVSYGIYLWHQVLLQATPWGMPVVGWKRPVAILLAIALAAASYYLLERPLLRIKRRFERASVPTPADTAHRREDAVAPEPPTVPFPRVAAVRSVAAAVAVPPAQRPRTGHAEELVSAARGR